MSGETRGYDLSQPTKEGGMDQCARCGHEKPIGQACATCGLEAVRLGTHRDSESSNALYRTSRRPVSETMRAQGARGTVWVEVLPFESRFITHGKIEEFDETVAGKRFCGPTAFAYDTEAEAREAADKMLGEGDLWMTNAYN